MPDIGKSPIAGIGIVPTAEMPINDSHCLLSIAGAESIRARGGADGCEWRLPTAVRRDRRVVAPAALRPEPGLENYCLRRRNGALARNATKTPAASRATSVRGPRVF